MNGIIRSRPEAVDIALVIEVSSSTRRKDEARAKLYARLGLPEYWLLDLGRALVVPHHTPEHSEQLGYRYASVTPVGRDATVAATTVDGPTFETNFLLQLAA